MCLFRVPNWWQANDLSIGLINTWYGIGPLSKIYLTCPPVDDSHASQYDMIDDDDWMCLYIKKHYLDSTLVSKSLVASHSPNHTLTPAAAKQSA